ncbi:MAG: replication-associated recombination protein A, partial [Bacteroidales bacterium]
VRTQGDLSVPLHLRNAPTELMKELGYARDYKYAHSYEGNFTDQDYLPQNLNGTVFYEPQDNAREKEIKKFLSRWGGRYSYDK